MPQNSVYEKGVTFTLWARCLGWVSLSNMIGLETNVHEPMIRIIHEPLLAVLYYL